MINVLDHGIISDGYTCSATMLERLIERKLPDAGGTLFFPPGQYALSRPLTINKSNVCFCGAGAGASQFISESPDQSYLVFGTPQKQCQNFTVRDLGFNAYNTRYGGSYLHLRNTFNASVHDCFFANGFISINLENAFSVRVNDCMIMDPTPQHGIGVLLHGNRRHSDQYLTRIFVQCQDQHPPAACGFRIANTQGLWMTECGAYRCTTGFELTSTRGMIAEHFFLSRNHADTCLDDGWRMEIEQGAQLRRVQSESDWSSSNGNNGWTIRNAGGTITDIMIRAPRAYQNTGPAFLIEGANGIDIIDATCAGNGRNVNVEAEVILSKDAHDIRITGGRFGGFSGLATEVPLLLQGGNPDAGHILLNTIGYGYKKLTDTEIGNATFSSLNHNVAGTKE